MILLIIVAGAWRGSPPRSGLAFLLLGMIWLSLTASMALIFGIADSPEAGSVYGSLAGPIIAGALVAALLEFWLMRRPASRWFARVPELTMAGIVGALTGLLWQGCDWLV